MACTSIQSEDLGTHLQEGAIYRDRSDNVIRLLSICGDYCVYVYVSLPNLQSTMHGSVTGLTRRNVFDADFVFVAESVEDWIGNRGKQSNRLTDDLHKSLLAAQSMSRRPEPRAWLVRRGLVSRNSHREHIIRRAS